MLFPSSSGRWTPLQNLPDLGHFPVPSGSCSIFCPEFKVTSAVGLVRWGLKEPLPEVEPPYNFVSSTSEERENPVCACRIFDSEIPFSLKSTVASLEKLFLNVY